MGRMSALSFLKKILAYGIWSLTGEFGGIEYASAAQVGGNTILDYDHDNDGSTGTMRRKEA
jgi:hypothetical protein